jgi:aminoglycoside 6-adenylyltransferase
MPREEHDVVSSLARWAESNADIRAVLLTSSRANPHATVDEFSDYDVILAVTDIGGYLESDAWLEHFGRVLTVYRDPIHIEFGLGRFIRVTHYEDGTKIDYTVYPVDLLTRIAREPELPADLDVGYTVLVDKDKLTEQLKPPTYKAHIPAMPTEKEYQTLVEEFFSEAMYVAKHICREDLMPLKHCLDCMAKQEHLRKLLEWRVELNHQWSWKPGAYGRNLKKYVAPAIWSELAGTYVGAGTDKNWDALFRIIGIFRRVAMEIADSLSYSYPESLDHRVVMYLEKTRGLYG